VVVSGTAHRVVVDQIGVEIQALRFRKHPGLGRLGSLSRLIGTPVFRPGRLADVSSGGFFDVSFMTRIFLLMQRAA
jgi:hypothetical protein